jgi:hypothetical protein
MARIFSIFFSAVSRIALVGNPRLGGEFIFFAEAEILADNAGLQLAKLRLTDRQMYRVSQVGRPTNETERSRDYFKRSIWLPYLDEVIVEMQDKFSQTSQTAFLLSSVLTCQKVQMENFKKAFSMYEKCIDCFEEVRYEKLLLA